MFDKRFAELLGQALFLASIQASVGSVEMSSKFSVKNFSKDQETLQNASDALQGYIIVGVVWTVATIFILYSQFDWCGALIGTAMNLLMMGWIIISYIMAFKSASKKYNLQMPTLFGIKL
jgi:small-conductance mechanosensitive channel